MAMKKRADGRYQVAIQDGYDPKTGKVIRKVFYGETQKEAKAKRDEYRKNKSLGLKQDSKLTVAEWAYRWLNIYGQGSYSTEASNRQAVDKLAAFMGDRPLCKIVKSDIQLFADSVKDKSFSLVKKTQMVTQNVFREAMSDRLLQFDPTMGVDWDYGSKGTHRALEPWETDFITEHWRDHRFGILIMLMLYGGLRRGEVLALKWGDIYDDTIHIRQAGHFENNTFVTEEGAKTEAGVRDIPVFSSALRTALAECRGDDDQLIADGCCPNGKLTKQAFRKGWDGYITTMQNILNGREAVRPGQRTDLIKVQQVFAIRAHDLRHTFCTMLFEAGVDMKTAQMLMGHADEQMIMQVYAHLRDKLKEESIGKLRAMFG